MTLLTYSIIFLIGTLSAEYYPNLPNPRYLSILILFIFLFYNKNKYSLSFIIYLLGLGLASSSYYTTRHTAWFLNHIYYKPLLLTLKINNIYENTFNNFKANGTKDLIVTASIICIEPNKNIKSCPKCCLNLPSGMAVKVYFSGISLNQARKIFEKNKIIQIKTILKPQILQHNFIDNEGSYNLYHGSFCKPIKTHYKEIIILNSKPNFLTRIDFRDSLLQKFLEHSKDYPYYGIVMALLFGIRDYISLEHLQVFTTTGTGHLIAISGMHVSLVFYIILVLSQYIWRIKIYKYCNQRNFSILVSWVFTVFYAYISGMSVPTQRALIAISIITYSQLKYLKLSIFNIFGICLISVLITEPLVIYSASFWLSFNATFWLLYIYSNFYHLNSQDYELSKSRFSYYKNKISRLFKSNFESCSKLFIALLPITIYYFNSIALGSILANLIAIPLVSMVILPLLILSLIIFLLVFLFPEQLYTLELMIKAMLWLADGLLNQLILLLNLLSSSQYLFFDRYSLSILSMITLLFLAPKGLFKWPLITCLCTLFYFYKFHHSDIPGKNNREKLVIDVLDVGQGLAVLVNTKHHQLLYDTGPKLHYNLIADKVVTNSLLNYKIFSNYKLDAIVISHWDADHSANLERIISNLNLNRGLTGNNSNQLTSNNFEMSEINFYSSHLEQNVIFQNKFPRLNPYYCNANIKWEWDGVEFRFLQTSESQVYSRNNSSCILKISYNNRSILLTGDIEKPIEGVLISKYPKIIPSDILLVPHHGSKTSSSLEFIRQVAPKYALISVGKDNIYHLPNNDVIKRYKQLGIKIYRTDKHGGIKATIANDTINIDQALSGS